MGEETLSVLLPNFNNGPYLKEALDSLFAQTFTNFVILFVDDCSTDNSLEIAKSYQDDRLRILEKETNSGIVDTLNLGLAQIDSTYFIRMDGDDISKPDRFEKLVGYMQANPNIGICSSDIRTFGDDNILMTYERDPLMNKANLIFGHAIGHASSIFRTAVFKKYKITYRDLFWRLEDYDLFYQLKDLTLSTSISGDYYLYRRESYNHNPEIELRKSTEFKRFYKQVLTDLGMNPTEDQLHLHLQLNNREAPGYRMKDYIQYTRQIAEINKKRSVYPIKELDRVFSKYLEKMVYRLISLRKITFWELVPIFKNYPGLMRYYFRNSIHRLKTGNKE